TSSLACNPADARARAAAAAIEPEQYARPLFDVCADVDASHQQRPQYASVRSAGPRHSVGRDERQLGLSPGIDAARSRSTALADRRGAALFAGWRRGDFARLVRTRRLSPHRFWRVSRLGVACQLN